MLLSTRSFGQQLTQGCKYQVGCQGPFIDHPSNINADGKKLPAHYEFIGGDTISAFIYGYNFKVTSVVAGSNLGQVSYCQPTTPLLKC